MNEQPTVFISYSQSDIKIAEKLYQDLRNAGANPWMDKHDLKAGKKWKLTITQAIKDSDYVITLLSSQSVQRRGFIQKEQRIVSEILDTMPDSDTFVIPVRLDDCELPPRLEEFHFTDLFPPSKYKDGLEKICKTLKIEKPIQPPPYRGCIFTASVTIALMLFIVFLSVWLPPTKTGSLYIDTLPADTKIEFPNRDGLVYKKGIRLEPGEYTIKISKPGFEDLISVIEIKPGEKNKQKVTLNAIATPNPGSLIIKTIPADAIIEFVDNKNINYERGGISLKPDKYKIKISKPGFKESIIVVEIKPGETIERKVTLEPKPGSLYIETIPAGAKIEFIHNNDLVYKYGIELEPGEYKIKISKIGFKESVISVEIRPGEKTKPESIKLESFYKKVPLGILDEKNGLIWQEPPQGPMKWSQTNNYVKDGWRLPSKEELISLHEFIRENNIITRAGSLYWFDDHPVAGCRLAFNLKTGDQKDCTDEAILRLVKDTKE